MKRARITKKPYTYKGKTEDRWLVLWTDLKGKRREKWFQNKRHADAYAIKIDREIEDNVQVADGATMTFAMACEMWLKNEERRADSGNRNADLTKGSLAGKQSVAKNHLLPYFGNMRLSKIESAEIKRFVDDQAYRFAHWTARRHKNLVKQVFDFAVANGWLRVSPLTNKPVMVPGTDPKRDDIPEVEGVAKLLDVLLTRPRPRNFNLNSWSSVQVQIVLGALMGLRPGEIAGLQWENVDLTKWTISVEHTLSHFDGLKGPKTKSSYRILDLEPLSHRVLKEHAERTINGGLGRTTERRQLTGYVLTTAQNGRVMPTTLRWRHHNILKLAGLADADDVSNFTPHALRHFAGSLWLAEGMTLKDVSWRLGHKTTIMTENIYLHQLRHDKRAKHVMHRLAADRFPGIEGSSLDAPLPAMRIVDDDTPPKVIGLKATTTVAALLPPAKIPDVPRIRPDRYTARPPGRRPRTMEDAPQWLDEALDLLEQGYGIVEIARRLQRGESTVTAWLKVAGIAKPGIHAHAVRTADLEAKFAEMSAAGYQLTDIAYRLGVKLNRVKRWRIGRTPGNRLRRENDQLENLANKLKEKVKSAQALKPNTGKMRGKQHNLL
jgi:integrase